MKSQQNIIELVTRPDLYRTGLVSERDPVLVYKAMPCVVRLTKEEEDVETRVLAAETLAFLIEQRNMDLKQAVKQVRVVETSYLSFSSTNVFFWAQFFST